MSIKPRFIQGVWVGRLSDVGFVVYDLSISNLYEYNHGNYNFSDFWKRLVLSDRTELEEGLEKISLWVYESQKRQYFDVPSVKKDLRSNIHLISKFQRKKIANSYHHWIYSNAGCHTKHEYEQRLEQMELDKSLADSYNEPTYCEACNGSGEEPSVHGFYNGLTCSYCGGSGMKP